MVEKRLPLVVRLKNSTLIYLGVDEQDFLPYFYHTETKKSTLSLLYFKAGLYTQRRQTVYQMESNAVVLPLSAH